MNRATPRMRVFAERLITYERQESRRLKIVPPAFAEAEKLRPQLVPVLGKAGFRVLLARALTLASAEAAWLRAVHIRSDGSLEGLEELATQMAPEEFSEGRVVLLARLLGLLVAFIGENLTLQLVQEIWPTLSLNDLELKGDEDEEEK